MSEQDFSNSPSEDGLSIQSLVALFLSKWKWFALSVILCLGLATLYILTTPPSFQRKASILIKEDGKNSTAISSDLNAFSDMGLFSSSSNVHNELNSIQSPASVMEVVKRLHLDINYLQNGTFHKKELYGSNLPIAARIEGLDCNDVLSFALQVDKAGQVKLGELKLNGEEVNGGKAYSAKLNDSIATPIGAIWISPSPYYEAGTETELQIVRQGIIASVDNCIKKLTASISDQKTSIIDLSYKDVSIQRSEEFLNTLIAVYNENWVKNNNQIAVSTSQFIDERLAVIEQELGNVDSDISSYKSANLIPDIQAASNMYMEKANEANTQILNLNNQLYMARYIRNFVTTDSNKDQLLPVNSGINSPNIERQLSDYNEKLLQRNSLAANSSSNNPLVIDLDNALSAMRGAIVSSIDNQINALNTQIRGFRSSEQQSTARIASNPTQAKYLLSVERQQKVKESLYLYLLQKREENELSQAFTAYNTRIITPPTGTLAPIAPQKRNILLAALMAGLLIPAGILVLLESLNTKLRGRRDLERLTIPFIGEIPLHRDLQKRKLLQRKTPRGDAHQILVREHSRNVVNEAFRVVRTNLEFMMEADEQKKVLMVTSFNPNSGKSFISINLAASFAINGKKTIVIDLDMRKSALSKYADTPELGISKYLNGSTSNWRELIVKVEGHPRLDLIPVGTIPPNPTELLFQPALSQLIDELRQQYDTIILDCPPVGMVADTSIIGKWIDTTIFVVRAGLLERDMLPVLEGFYTEKTYQNLTVLLNGSEAAGKYGYNYGYGYGYASSEVEG